MPGGVYASLRLGTKIITIVKPGAHRFPPPRVARLFFVASNHSTDAEESFSTNFGFTAFCELRREAVLPLPGGG